MKKSKILLPILGACGTAAAVAPMVCLVSCSGVKIDFTSSDLINRSSKKDENGKWVLTALFRPELSIKKVNHDKSTIQLNGNSSTLQTFTEAKNDVTVEETSTNVTITILATYPDQFGMKAKSIQVNVVCGD